MCLSLALETAETNLTQEQVAFKRIKLTDIGATDLVLSSGVVLRFYPSETANDLCLTSFLFQDP